MPVHLSELRLNSTFLTAPECIVLAGNPNLAQLTTLDLSCNPLSIVGLINLIHPRRSNFRCLQSLVLYNCEIDSAQSYLVSNDLDDTKVNFQLTKLNLSHNKLSFLLNYAVELGLVNNCLQELHLFNCALDDEQILKLADCKQTEALQVLDAGENLFDANFSLIMRVLREHSP